jgi:anhydro-N-acetylmuramic acid kinase
LEKIDSEYTLFLSEIIKKFIEEHHIQNPDAVCSHGHTALHQPEIGLTYQIGNQKQLATLLNQTVVCDFRVQDVALGGQGAPLVPIGDKLLFHEYDFCLNLGGFANISTESNAGRIAYDICPVNIVLNHYVHKMDLEYDDKGQIASRGRLNNDLLNTLNALEYYKLKHPKSLGLEWVNKKVIPIIDSFHLSTGDILRTFVEHISIQISNEINIKNNALVLITGGGAFNEFLIERIKTQTKNDIIIPSKIIIEYKEAIVFGLLGVLKLRNEVNCLSSVTGAKYDHSSGHVFIL